MSAEAWTTVEPLTDTPEQHQYWREPRIGDRVRVHLSGECQYRFRYASTEQDGVIFADDRPVDGSHEDAENGRTGHIAHIVGEGLLATTDVREEHKYVVDYDLPMRDADGPVHGKTYAACELEILP